MGAMLWPYWAAAQPCGLDDLVCFPHAIVGAGWYLQPVIFGCPGCQYWYCHIQIRMRPSQRPQPAADWMFKPDYCMVLQPWVCTKAPHETGLASQCWCFRRGSVKAALPPYPLNPHLLAEWCLCPCSQNDPLLAPSMAVRFGFLSLGSCVSTRSDLDVKGMQFNVVSIKLVGFLSWHLVLHSVCICGVLSLTAWSEAVGPLNYIWGLLYESQISGTSDVVAPDGSLSLQARWCKTRIFV